MKIVTISNYEREDYDEKLIAENIPNKELATIMADALNDKNNPHGPDYFMVVKDDYQLKERN